MSTAIRWPTALPGHGSYTQLGYPVILVNLGFLRAEEMRKGREQTPFDSHDKWECLVKAHSEPLFPSEVWDRQCVIHGQLVARICSIETPYDGPMETTPARLYPPADQMVW